MVIRNASAWYHLGIIPRRVEADMSRKKAGVGKVPTTQEPAVKHARIELPDGDYQRLKKAAARYRISVAAYIRQAVLKQVERDESRGGPK